MTETTDPVPKKVMTQEHKDKLKAAREAAAAKRRAEKDAQQEVADARETLVDFGMEVNDLPPTPVPALPTPRASLQTAPPEARQWPPGLIRILSRHCIMWEDFQARGRQLNVQTVRQYAEQADRGNAEGLKVLEPIKQAVLELMGRQTYKKPIFDPDTRKPRLKRDPKNPKRWEPEDETRSVWGVADGTDQTVTRGAVPRPRQWYDMVDAHFPKLILAGMQALRPIPQIHTTRSYMNTNLADSIRAEHKRLVDPAQNPKRAMWLKHLKPIIEGRAKTAWDGRS